MSSRSRRHASSWRWRTSSAARSFSGTCAHRSNGRCAWGRRDLTEREVEVEQLNREVAERRARLSAEEAELERRRGELGAVELKREADRAA